MECGENVILLLKKENNKNSIKGLLKDLSKINAKNNGWLNKISTQQNK